VFVWKSLRFQALLRAHGWRGFFASALFLAFELPVWQCMARETSARLMLDV